MNRFPFSTLPAKPFLFAALLLSASTLLAEGPWKFRATTADKKVTLHIDLHDETVEVPGMEMFGTMAGYLKGEQTEIYGLWMLTSSEIVSQKQAKVRLSNDLGSETQEVLLTLENDSTCKAELRGTVCIKKVVDGKKLKKIDPVIVFNKSK